MAILKLIFGRQSATWKKAKSRPKGPPPTHSNTDSVSEDAPQPAELNPADAANFPTENADPYGHARKIGRPTTISRPQPRPDRVKSRLMNFGQLDAVLDEMEGVVQPSRRAVSRPVGWLVVIEGPGTGAWFTLQSGLSRIGRGEDQTVRLDFGDTAVSRATHASIAYEPADHRFRLGLGECENDILVNGASVRKPIDLHHGDLITVGETTLRLAAFCDDRFAWAPIIDKGDRNAASA